MNRLSVVGTCGLILFLQFGVIHSEELLPIEVVSHHTELNGAKTYRSVAMRLPWLYAVDRDGGLQVFRVPMTGVGDFTGGFVRFFSDLAGSSADRLLRKDIPPLEIVYSIKNAGDGNDAQIFDNVLSLTSKGKLSAYNLDDPSKPKLLGNFGSPLATDSQSIVRAGKHVVILGDGQISSYDFSDPNSPKHLATLDNGRGNWNGCSQGNLLYVCEVSRRRNHRMGIAVYDITNPLKLTEQNFIETNRTPYHVCINTDGHLLASLDSSSFFHFFTNRHITVNGSTQIFQVNNDQVLKPTGIVGSSGGRSVHTMNYADTTIMICNGLAFRSKNAELQQIGSFFPYGTTLDGFPYHGDHDGPYVALATDNELSVLRITESVWHRLGKYTAFVVVQIIVRLF